MTHEIIDDLNWRRTTKKFDPERKVSEEDLNTLLEAIRLTPSSINSQPWRFVVLDSQEARERMAGTFTPTFEFNRPHVFDASYFILFGYNPRYTREDYAEVVDKQIEDGRIKPEDREKGFRSFFFAELNTDENGDTSCWTKAQLYIALGNALHALARMRIDATPIEGLDADRVNREFADELAGYRCDVALAIGYHHPDDYNAALPKSRRRMDSIVLRI